MKQMRKLFFIFCFLPGLTFASLDGDINSLLDKFFGSGQAPESEETFLPATDDSVMELDVPEVEVPQNPEEEDLNALREQIFLEEMGAGDFDQAMQEKEKHLQSIQSQKNALENQLFLLDSQIGSNTESLKSVEERVQKWKSELEKLTYERSELRAEIKVAQRDYEQFMSKNVVQMENFGAGEDVSVVNWLLSNKTVSQIIEERRKKAFTAEQKAMKMQTLNALKKKLEQKEKQASFFYAQLSKMGQNTAKEKKTFQLLAEQKSQQLSQLSADEIKSEQELANIQRQRNESAIYLQNLRTALKETQERLREKYENPEDFTDIERARESEAFFDFPLKIESEITAHFHDPAYEKTMHRVHEGVDFFSPQGSDIFAPADGVVKKTGMHNYGYSYLILQHKKGFYTVYGHVSEILVNEGQAIERGELIAKTGGTAGTKGAGYFTSGPHLHFEVYRDGKNLNPLDYMEFEE